MSITVYSLEGCPESVGAYLQKTGNGAPAVGCDSAADYVAMATLANPTAEIVAEGDPDYIDYGGHVYKQNGGVVVQWRSTVDGSTWHELVMEAD